ncbi:MAG: hypothetical protein ACRC5H_01615 [Treponemataceae bacterium]
MNGQTKRQRLSFDYTEEVDKNPLNIYIGLDFGTSFTKVSFSYSSTVNKIRTLKFYRLKKDSYFFPTIVSLDRNTCCFEPLSYLRKLNSDCLEQIKYFKINMAQKENTLPSLSVKSAEKFVTKNKLEILCSVFFLSQIIGISKKSITAILQKENIHKQINWHVNMGVPFDDNTKKEEKENFETVLAIAYQLANENICEKINLDFLDKYYSDNQNEKAFFTHTFPELAAEVISYQENKNIGKGFYSLIDIGGGTVDIAMFYKGGSFASLDEYCCLYQKVIPLGVESLVNRIINKQIETTFYQVMEDLKHGKYGTEAINEEALKGSMKEFRRAYRESLVNSKEIKSDEMAYYQDSKKKIPYFLMGGGAKISIYNGNIENIKDLKNCNIPMLENEKIEEYSQTSFNLEVHNNRLIISQILARPIEMLKEPWATACHFKNGKKEIKKAPDLEDIQRELHGR